MNGKKRFVSILFFLALIPWFIVPTMGQWTVSQDSYLEFSKPVFISYPGILPYPTNDFYPSTEKTSDIIAKYGVLFESTSENR